MDPRFCEGERSVLCGLRSRRLQSYAFPRSHWINSPSLTLVVPAPGTHENRRCETILAALLLPAIFVGPESGDPVTTQPSVITGSRLSLRCASLGRDDSLRLPAIALTYPAGLPYKPRDFAAAGRMFARDRRGPFRRASMQSSEAKRKRTKAPAPPSRTPRPQRSQSPSASGDQR